MPYRNTDPCREAGLTLVELMISMLVFSIFLTILLSSILGVTKAATQAQVIARAASGTLSVFQNFDREIRYADAINYPGAGTGGARYVEFRIPAVSSGTNAICKQWRFDPGTGLLQSRQWFDVAPFSIPVWATRLSVVFDDGGSTYPFAVSAAQRSGSAMQQLTLTLDAGNANQRGAAISSNFVARNSSIASASNDNVIYAGASGARVCTAGART
jgi:prepilin-type N-terminal cleavage/methylation domain-containing protein